MMHLPPRPYRRAAQPQRPLLPQLLSANTWRELLLLAAYRVVNLKANSSSDHIARSTSPTWTGYRMHSRWAQVSRPRRVMDRRSPGRRRGDRATNRRSLDIWRALRSALCGVSRPAHSPQSTYGTLHETCRPPAKPPAGMPPAAIWSRWSRRPATRSQTPSHPIPQAYRLQTCATARPARCSLILSGCDA